MSVTADILRTYRAPRAVMRRHLSSGARDDRALAFLMAACLLIFVSQWPTLARAAHLDPSIPLDARLGGALLAMLFMLPLICYAIAAVAHLLARLVGGRGTWLSARLALFWSMLAISPLMLLQGALAGLVGGAVSVVTGIVVLGLFLRIWGAAMAEAESG